MEKFNNGARKVRTCDNAFFIVNSINFFIILRQIPINHNFGRTKIHSFYMGRNYTTTKALAIFEIYRGTINAIFNAVCSLPKKRTNKSIVWIDNQCVFGICNIRNSRSYVNITIHIFTINSCFEKKIMIHIIHGQ